MTANPTKNNSPMTIRQFTASKQIEFFESLKQPRFSGQLTLTDNKGVTWTFYLYLGRIMYATGGSHPVRRWRRNLADYCPQVLPHLADLQADISHISAQELRTCWEYKLLSLWIDQKRITREQASSIIRSTVVEIMFDLARTMEVSCEFKQDNLLSTRLILIDAEQVIVEADKIAQAWQNAKIADRSPNMAPVIRQPEQLKQKTSPQVYQNLTKLLDGSHTLRDLAVRMKRDVLTVTRSLLPYLQLGLVQLVNIADLPSPMIAQVNRGIPQPVVQSNQNILIACVDDSPLVCQTMEKILTANGYRFLGINNGLRAIATLLSRKPDLIFLDLIMPNTNGYEICSQLRKLSFFRNTPIVILTGNDGIIDRVRAKMVGSTDFIGKPVTAEIVQQTLQKHLGQKV
ncbi:MAG: response regulator, partial [Cyanobacteria bacterium J083]